MKDNYSHETFEPGFDPHGNNTKIEREEGLEVAGVNLVGSNEVLLTPMITSPTPARLMMMGNPIHAEEADDETYALSADAPRKPMLGDWMSQGQKTDKGVIVQVIPDDHIPTDVEGNKAEILVHPRNSMIGLSAAHDGDTLSGDQLVIVVAPNKPKQPTNHQRHGYSRRKAKRAYQARYKYMLKVSKYWDPLMSHLHTFGIPTRSDVHMEQFMGRVRNVPEKFDKKDK